MSTLNQIKTIFTRREQIKNDIENLRSTRSYYIGIKYELDIMGETNTNDYKSILTTIKELTDQINQLQNQVE